MQDIAQGASASLGSSIQIQVTFLDENNGKSIADQIADASIRRSALVISKPNDPLLRRALTSAHDAGLPIIQFVNRNMPGGEFAGFDNYATGRIAGMMIRLVAKPSHVRSICSTLRRPSII